jgi:hypothetical protein
MDREVVFPEHWTPPRELTRALPRETKLSGRGMLHVVLGVVFLVASVGLGIWLHGKAVQEAAKTAAFHSQSQEASGEITKLWYQDTREREPMVTYAFTANGVRMEGESPVPTKLWAGIRKAGFLPVRYLPSNPAINHPAAWDEAGVPEWFPIVLPATWVAVGAFLLFRVWREARVATDGVPAPGVVTRCFRVKGGWSARYQFQTPDGAILKGRDKVQRKVDEGSTTCVLYLPDNPRRSNLYPLCLHKVQE